MLSAEEILRNMPDPDNERRAKAALQYAPDFLRSDLKMQRFSRIPAMVHLVNLCGALDFALQFMAKISEVLRPEDGELRKAALAIWDMGKLYEMIWDAQGGLERLEEYMKKLCAHVEAARPILAPEECRLLDKLLERCCDSAIEKEVDEASYYFPMGDIVAARAQRPSNCVEFVFTYPFELNVKIRFIQHAAYCYIKNLLVADVTDAPLWRRSARRRAKPARFDPQRYLKTGRGSAAR